MTEVIKQALSPFYTALLTIALIIWTSIATAVITLFILRKMKRGRIKNNDKQWKYEVQKPKFHTEIEKNNRQEIIQSRDFLHDDIKKVIQKPKPEIKENDNYVVKRRIDKTKEQRFYNREKTTKEIEPEEVKPYPTNWQPDKTKEQPINCKEEKKEHQQRIKEIGETGERTSNFKTLPIVVYGKQLRNLYVPTKYEETTEIDTILISVSGIYVIETKNYSGKIYGREEQKNWVVWYSEKKKYPFYNPIKQNEAHVMALKSFLHEVNGSCFFSIIVFSDKCNIQKIEYNRATNLITQQGNLSKEFKEMLIRNEGKLSRQEVNDIFERLKKFANASEEVKQKHIASVRRKRTNSYYYDN